MEIFLYCIGVFCLFLIGVLIGMRIQHNFNENQNNLNRYYLAYQGIVVRNEFIGNNNYIEFDVVIRLVEANSEDEAMGKFQKETYDVKANQKLNIISHNLSTIKKITI